MAFSKRSVAWVSVFTGKTRWYKRSYRDNDDVYKKIVLYANDNSAVSIPGVQGEIYLDEYYQKREGDYEAFVVFPVPQRFRDGAYVKGALHISFRLESDFKKIWTVTDIPSVSTEDKDLPAHVYADADQILEARMCTKEPVRESLSVALPILEELLRGFNENIYKSSTRDESAA